MTKGHFEAKKHAYRQTQDGVVISFVVHPNDVSAAIATAPLGTRYMVGFAEIGDDERPKAPVTQLVESDPKGESQGGECVGSSPTGSRQSRDRRPFDSLPLSQQAALRCNDASFRTFLVQCDGAEATFRMYDTEMAADSVRAMCKVASRSLIIEGDKSGDYWLDLEARYQRWLTDRQYADSAR